MPAAPQSSFADPSSAPRLRTLVPLLSLALLACTSSAPPGRVRPEPIPLPPPGPPQLTGRSPKVLLRDEVMELRALVEQIRPIDFQYPEILERYAIALLELSDHHRAEARTLDRGVLALPPPRDRALASPSPGGAEGEATDEPLPLMLQGLSYEPPPRDALALQRLRPEARAALHLADGLAAEAMHWLRKLAVSPRAKERSPDRILFELASVEDDLGQRRDARATYLRLLRLFPQSEYAPQAWLAFGHHAFEEVRLDEAATYFDKALALANPKAAAIAAHQLARVRSEQKRPDEAWAALGKAAVLAREKAPALLEAICGDAKTLRPAERLEGCER